MNDRELLTLAAKASNRAVGVYLGDELGFEAPFFGEWNPLNDDGDALRLSVKLNMHLDINEYEAIAYVVNTNGFKENATMGYGIEEATRRAIVRAAAAIGESMP